MRLRAYRLELWVLVDGDLAVVDEPGIQVGLDDSPPEVLHARVAGAGLQDRHLLNVHCIGASWLRDPEHVVEDESVVLDELVGIGGVAEVPFAWGVGVERCEWWGVDGEVDRLVFELGKTLAAISE